MAFNLIKNVFFLHILIKKHILAFRNYSYQMDRIKNIFDKIGSLIPGYKGYAEREGRRNCDKILRESIVAKLMLLEKQLNEKMLESVDKIIYAIGYKPNLIDGIDITNYQAGELVQGIFGMGIAFPEVFVDQFGNHENLIGLDSFIDYARKRYY
jgi:hypothetical protein